MRSSRSIPLLLALAFVPAPAMANDDAVEFWFNPSASWSLDDNTGLELETGQRIRRDRDGRADNYFARLWVHQDVSRTLALSGAVERSINDGGADETRLMQQFSTRHGILRTRVRFEQRFVDDADRMGLRLRTRLGLAMPLREDSPWSLEGDAELFTTLRSTRVGGATGATRLRNFAGVGYEASDRVKLTFGYLREHNFQRNGVDQVGHAPFLGLDLSF